MGVQEHTSARVAELRQKIEQRHAANKVLTPPASSDAVPVGPSDEWTNAVEELVADAEDRLQKAAKGQEALQDDLKQLVNAYHQVSNHDGIVLTN